MTDATDRAIQAVHELISEWLGPAAHRHLYRPDNNAAEKLCTAIRAIAAERDTSHRIGWAVFKRALDTEYDRERPSGYIHTLVSAVFENLEQAQNAHEYCCGKHDGEYVICELQEKP